MSYVVYILRCKDKTLYVGYTNDIQKRIVAHNNSKSGAHYTKTRRPVALVHQEKYKTLSRALKREHEIKSWKRAEKLKLISGKKIAPTR